ncbi:MAG: Ku domain-containing protein [Actinomycetia bacterium]|nr:Ku domain-containing protein [Actinomycetes bacterium]
MRSLFSGTLGFGLVAIPVQLYKALENDQVALHWVHRPCGSRIQYKKWCPVCDRIVAADELVKAGVLEDGRLVPLDEPQPVRAPAERTIGLVSFHAADEIDPIYYDQAYWVAPGAGGRHPYAVLWTVLRETGRVGLAELTLARRRRLAVVRPWREGLLALQTLHWPESLRTLVAPAASAAVPSPKEIRLARTLVDALTEPFRPEAYPNRAKQDLLERLAARAGEAIAVRAPAGMLADLVAQLKASVEAVERAAPAADGGAAEAAPPARRRRARAAR